MNAPLRTVLLCTLALGACERSRAGAPAPTGQPTAADPGATAPGPADPATPRADHAAAAGGVTGKILETMDSGGYTYVRLAVGDGEQWAAVNATKVAVGDTVTITNATEMVDFESKTLGRTFPSILFGTLGGDAAGATAGAAANPHGDGMVAGTSTGAPTDAPIKLDQPLPKAEGATGRTVAEVFAQQGALAGQRVTVRGKVTKYNGEIMDRNWLHVQDGTGTAAQHDYDLTVTTSGTAAIGDIVVVDGVVGTDRDFGAGYAYKVIVENATVTVQH
ncbi:MAG: nucleotide-binding protein [Kofleriaceae bacterium]|nr:nucleotide-binding protein [Kofleriaceae bacterium]